MRSPEQEKFVAELREKIAVGMGQIKRGEVVEGKTVFKDLRAKLKRRDCDIQ